MDQIISNKKKMSKSEKIYQNNTKIENENEKSNKSDNFKRKIEINENSSNKKQKTEKEKKEEKKEKEEKEEENKEEKKKEKKENKPQYTFDLKNTCNLHQKEVQYLNKIDI
jgi:hypothetical protein